MNGTPICVRNLHRRQPVNTRLLQRVGEAALAALEPKRVPSPPASAPRVAVLLVGKRHMTSLNERFLGHAGPTDVITFDYAERQAPVSGAPTLQGEIFICLDEARRQAREFGATWQAEVVRYLAHGLLHLSGYDDLEPAARRRMKRIENRLVQRLASRFAFKRLGQRSRFGA